MEHVLELGGGKQGQEVDKPNIFDIAAVESTKELFHDYLKELLAVFNSLPWLDED